MNKNLKNENYFEMKKDQKKLISQNNKNNINKSKNIKEKNEIENKNKNDNFISNNNSFSESDIDEFKNIFNHNELKNNIISNKSYESSNLFDGSEDINKNEGIELKELDPKIKDILILFVLSDDYYQLLVKEKARKAFKFNNKKK